MSTDSTMTRPGRHASVEARRREPTRIYREKHTFLDDSRFEEVGTISFGNGNSLRFRSIEPGRLTPAAVPHLLHGSISWEFDGGAGAFEGATGRIVSNFLVSNTGELTDRQLGVVLVREASRNGKE